MAAREGSREGTFCERCFAPLGTGEAICPDCGAPTSVAAPGADSPVHRELAAANLLRLRGDLDGSEKALLTVLRRYPNDPLAHEMLGEVCAERGELERAIEWYELALDLAPNSTEAKRRLQEAHQQLEARHTADTAETLGLPSARPTLTWAPLVGVGVLVVLAAGIALWPRSAAPRPLQATVVAPTAPVPAATTPSTVPETTPATTMPTTPSTVESTATVTGTDEERKLLEALRAQAGAARVQSALLDPRTQTLTVAFEIAPTDDPKALSIAVGKTALGIAPTAMTATLHALRAGRLVFAADLPRSAMASATPLTNLWPAESPVSTPPTAGTSAGTSATTPPVSPSTAPPTTGEAGSSPAGTGTETSSGATSGLPATSPPTHP